MHKVFRNIILLKRMRIIKNDRKISLQIIFSKSSRLFIWRAYIFKNTFARVGRFILSSYKENTKRLSLQSKYKYIKNSMTTAIAQKSYKALFSLWILKKKDILKLIN